MQERRRGPRPSAAAALALSALIAGLYAVLALRVLQPETLYSIDAAIKFVQARSLLAHRFLAMPLENRAAFIDPRGRFVPFEPPYVFERRGVRQAIYSTPGAVLFAPWSAFGAGALVWPAILGSFLLLIATYRLGAEGPVPWAVPVVLGVSTMLWFYSVQPSEHPLAVALSTLALVVAARVGIGPRGLVAAGLLAGIAAALRDEAILIVPGVLLARWFAGVRGRALARECAIVTGTVASVLVAVGVVDYLMFERPIAAHLQHAVAPLRDYLGIEAQVPSLRGMTWRKRYETMVEYWLLGTSRVAPAVAIALVLAAGAWIRVRTGSALLLLAGVASVLAAALLDLRAILPAPKFIAGLFRLCPFLVFAFLPLPPGLAATPARRLALAASGCYLVLAFVGLNTTGGKPLGPRLLLPILPLLVVAAWEAIAGWTSRLRTKPIDGLVGLTGLLLVIAAAAIELGSTIPAYVQRNRSDSSIVRRVLSSPSRYIVIDDPYTFQIVAATHFDRIVLLAENGREARELGERLDSARVSSFDLITQRRPARLAFAPYALAGEERDGRLVRQIWRR